MEPEKTPPGSPVATADVDDELRSGPVQVTANVRHGDALTQGRRAGAAGDVANDLPIVLHRHLLAGDPLAGHDERDEPRGLPKGECLEPPI